MHALDTILVVGFFFGTLVIAGLSCALWHRLTRFVLLRWLGTLLLSLAINAVVGLAVAYIRVHFLRDPTSPALTEAQAHELVSRGGETGLYLGGFAGVFVVVRDFLQWLTGKGRAPDRSAE